MFEVQDQEPTKLDEAIDRLFDAMTTVECDSPEYAKMADQLVKLYKMKDIENNFYLKEQDLENKLTEDTRLYDLKTRELVLKETEVFSTARLKDIEISIKEKDFAAPNRVSVDTWAVIAANLLGIILIIGHERANVVTSKALGFVSKLR